MCPHKDLNVNGYASIRNHFNHVQLFVTPWTIACQAPLSIEFSRPDYWAPGDLPNLGTEPRSPSLWADSLPSEPPGKPIFKLRSFKS